MIILRGVNLFPSQIEELVLQVPELSPHFQCVLRRSGRLDSLTVRVEGRAETSPAERDRLAGLLRDSVKGRIGVSVEVEIVDAGGVARSVGKAVRLVDERPG
jgi:phenylacetate-CoA ligase